MVAAPRAIAFLVGVLLSGFGPASAAGPSLVDGAMQPWSAIGRINAGGQSFCSGALVGPDLVLTAAHCVYNFATRTWWPMEDIHFVAGYGGGRWVGHARARRVIRHPSFVPVHNPPFDQIAKDWAVIELDAPIGREAGWFAFAPPDRAAMAAGALALQLGYRRDRPHAPQISPPCRVHGLRQGVLLHDCLVPEGGSGSPLFARIGGRLVVVGVHSAQMRTVDRVMAAVVPLDQLAPFPHPLPPMTAEAESKSVAEALGRQLDGGVKPAATVEELMTQIDRSLRRPPSKPPAP